MWNLMRNAQDCNFCNFVDFVISAQTIWQPLGKLGRTWVIFGALAPCEFAQFGTTALRVMHCFSVMLTLVVWWLYHVITEHLGCQVPWCAEFAWEVYGCTIVHIGRDSDNQCWDLDSDYSDVSHKNYGFCSLTDSRVAYVGRLWKTLKSGPPLTWASSSICQVSSACMWRMLTYCFQGSGETVHSNQAFYHMADGKRNPHSMFRCSGTIYE